MTYSTVAIIYNPNSTGPSKKMSQAFKKKLHARLPKQKIELIATEYAGHAEKLAYELATSSKNPLIISSSGDGGYHEVVNGLMKAQNEGHSPVAGLLPAGNANDHFHNIHKDDIIDMIANNKVHTIDLLKMFYTYRGKQSHRYAHSYIGFGLTPLVSAELNKTKLNLLNETWFVIKALITWKPVQFTIEGNSAHYDSIIISNVDKMSKYLTVSHPSEIDDGTFEVSTLKHQSRFKLLFTLLKATLTNIEEDETTDSYSLHTTKKTIAQADGELIKIDKDTQVRVVSEKQTLRCLV